jgi:hypothetical protein
MADILTDFAICIDSSYTTTLPGAGVVRAKSTGDSRQIVIGRATSMATPFCNGITGLPPFYALPAAPNFSGRFIIVGRNGSEPTYWGCTDLAALIAQCTVLNNGDGTGFSDEEQELNNCRIFLNNSGYALSDNTNQFLGSYFP